MMSNFLYVSIQTVQIRIHEHLEIRQGTLREQSLINSRKEKKKKKIDMSTCFLLLERASLKVLEMVR